MGLMRNLDSDGICTVAPAPANLHAAFHAATSACKFVYHMLKKIRVHTRDTHKNMCFLFSITYLGVVWDSVTLSSKRENIKNAGLGGKRGGWRTCRIWATSSVAIATLRRFGLPNVMISCLNWDYGECGEDNGQKEYKKENRWWSLVALHFFDTFMETRLIQVWRA